MEKTKRSPKEWAGIFIEALAGGPKSYKEFCISIRVRFGYRVKMYPAVSSFGNTAPAVYAFFLERGIIRESSGKSGRMLTLGVSVDEAHAFVEKSNWSGVKRKKRSEESDENEQEPLLPKGDILVQAEGAAKALRALADSFLEDVKRVSGAMMEKAGVIAGAITKAAEELGMSVRDARVLQDEYQRLRGEFGDRLRAFESRIGGFKEGSPLTPLPADSSVPREEERGLHVRPDIRPASPSELDSSRRQLLDRLGSRRSE